MSWGERIAFGVTWIHENGLWSLEQVFWGLMWIAAGASLFGLVFSFFERLWENNRPDSATVTYLAGRRLAGLVLAAVGFFGAIACLLVWAASGRAVGSAIDLLFKHLAGATSAFDVADMGALVACILTFVVGTFLTLSAEQRGPLTS